MLTRLRLRRDYKPFQRFLADKPSGPPDNESKTPVEQTAEKTSDEKTGFNNNDKIQELLKRMLTEPKIKVTDYSFTVAPERRRKSRDAVKVTKEKIEETLTKVATDVAGAIGGDVKQTEAELLSRVLGKINQTSTSLSDLLVGMKVDRTKETDGDALKVESRGQQVKRIVDKSRAERQTYQQRKGQTSQHAKDGQAQRKPRILQPPMTVDIFSGSPLGIFSSKESSSGTQLDLWESLKDRELTLATTQPPANYFQKMILWTEQGKVWKFPIDNEQGLEEEQNIHFSEHIFLDSHLEDWCPKKGPIRHFMELVCVGLSKNAFYTVQEKKDHIMWYKEYFESKKDVLTEVGAWDNAKAEATA